MRRCPRCGTIASDDDTLCGVCGKDLFDTESQSLEDAVTNEELARGSEKQNMKRNELSLEKRVGKRALAMYGVLAALFVVGIVLTTFPFQSDLLGLIGILLILFGLLSILFQSRRGKY